MSARKVPQSLIDEASRLYAVSHSINIVARQMGVDNSTISRYLRKAGIECNGHFRREIDPQPLPSANLDVHEIIAFREKQFEQKQIFKQQNKWREIKINTTDPVVLIFFGDPHLDDDGMNWPLLKEHIALSKLPNVYGINVGDTTNNWAGKLVRLYAHQDLGVESARKLAKWFLCEAGIKWFCWIFGNHDQWADGGTILELMNTEGVVMEDWQARVTAIFPTGLKVPIWIAHNFPGNSQWNLLHGPMKAAKMRGGAAIYACGDLHTWGLHHEELPDTGEIFWAIRSRGYKYIDHYAHTRGFPQLQHGASIAAVIDPQASTPIESVVCFADPAKAVQYQKAILHARKKESAL